MLRDQVIGREDYWADEGEEEMDDYQDHGVVGDKGEADCEAEKGGAVVVVFKTGSDLDEVGGAVDQPAVRHLGG